MDSLADLITLVRHEVADYVCPSPNATLYFLEDAANHVYAAISLPHRHKDKVRVVVMARVLQDRVIIDTDITDRPLLDTLLDNGIPRQQIVLAYQDEPIPG